MADAEAGGEGCLAPVLLCVAVPAYGGMRFPRWAPAHPPRTPIPLQAGTAPGSWTRLPGIAERGFLHCMPAAVMSVSDDVRGRAAWPCLSANHGWPSLKSPLGFIWEHPQPSGPHPVQAACVLSPLSSKGQTYTLFCTDLLAYSLKSMNL